MKTYKHVNKLDIFLFFVVGMNESDEKSDRSYEIVLYNKDRNDPDNKILIDIQTGKNGRQLFLKMKKHRVHTYVDDDTSDSDDDIDKDRLLLKKPIAIAGYLDSDGTCCW